MKELEVEIQLFNPLKTKRVCFVSGLIPYRAVNTLHIGYTKRIC
jgi:hypothetical protein